MNARTLRRASSCALAATLAAATPLAAQTGTDAAPVTRLSVVVAPAFQSWKFAKSVPLDSITVTGASQLSAPFAIEFPLGTRFTGSITGAIASSKLDAKSGTRTITRSFTGPSDLRVRASGPIIGNALRLTVGVNVPTGTVNLSPAQNDVIRVTAAPALDAQVPIAGTGFGATAGLVFARYIGSWAWAVGAGAEKRGKYSPLDAQIAGVDSRTELDPGGAGHFSVGADGLVGGNRLLLGIVTDLYGKDQLHQTVGGGSPVTQRYQLGPTVSAGAALEIKSATFRNLTLRVNERHRSGFRDGNNNTVDGSSGNYLDAGMSGLLGAPNRASLLLGVNVRQQTGLPIDKGFIGASLTGAGATIGASIPSANFEFVPTAQISVGNLKTQLVSSGMTSITIGLTVRRQ